MLCESYRRTHFRYTVVFTREFEDISNAQPSSFRPKGNEVYFFIKVNARWKIRLLVKVSMEWRNLG